MQYDVEMRAAKPPFTGGLICEASFPDGTSIRIEEAKRGARAVLLSERREPLATSVESSCAVGWWTMYHDGNIYAAHVSGT